ncbi:hypothetical protein Tco_0052638 [Tanacetum coccineum]
MWKHGYGYLEEIVVRRVDNALYIFKEGDFPRLQINDIEDMLILVVQNWLTNLSGDDVADFAIALRMFTRSLVIQKRSGLPLGLKAIKRRSTSSSLILHEPELRKKKKRPAVHFIQDLRIHLCRRLTRETERFDTSAGNPVKEILLKLNLPDHRSILMDSKEYIKMVMEDAKRPGEDMCGSYRVMWRGYGMSKEGYGARWRLSTNSFLSSILLVVVMIVVVILIVVAIVGVVIVVAIIGVVVVVVGVVVMIVVVILIVVAIVGVVIVVAIIGNKKYRGLNSSKGGNTRDGVKIAGGVIGSGGGIESSEELKEVLPDVADEAEV